MRKDDKNLQKRNSEMSKMSKQKEKKSKTNTNLTPMEGEKG